MDTLIIKHERWGGHFKDSRHKWSGVWESSGDLEDYGSRKSLVKMALDNNWKYKVLRVHRNGTTSIIQQSNNNQNEINPRPNRTRNSRTQN